MKSNPTRAATELEMSPPNQTIPRTQTQLNSSTSKVRSFDSGLSDSPFEQVVNLKVPNINPNIFTYLLL